MRRRPGQNCLEDQLSLLPQVRVRIANTDSGQAHGRKQEAGYGNILSGLMDFLECCTLSMLCQADAIPCLEAAEHLSTKPGTRSYTHSQCRWRARACYAAGNALDW